MNDSYRVYADFQSVAGLREGAKIEIAGVRVGFVEKIFLTENDEARIEMNILKGITLPEDSNVSVKTRGLIGEKIVCITIGGSPEIVPAGGVMFDTEPGFDLEDLLGKFIFGKV